MVGGGRLAGADVVLWRPIPTVPGEGTRGLLKIRLAPSLCAASPFAREYPCDAMEWVRGRPRQRAGECDPVAFPVHAVTALEWMPCSDSPPCRIAATRRSPAQPLGKARRDRAPGGLRVGPPMPGQRRAAVRLDDIAPLPADQMIDRRATGASAHELILMPLRVEHVPADDSPQSPSIPIGLRLLGTIEWWTLESVHASTFSWPSAREMTARSSS